jgi:hypothetical protein
MKVYKTKLDAMIAIANKKDQGGYFIEITNNGWFSLNRRCKHCGAATNLKTCPVNKKDCGR